MSEITIITNNQPRDILHSSQLPEKYRKEFDYLTDEEYADHAFFIYKKQAYSLREFLRTEVGSWPKSRGWHGYYDMSYFSGMLVKIVNDGDSVIVGQFYC